MLKTGWVETAANQMCFCQKESGIPGTYSLRRWYCNQPTQQRLKKWQIGLSLPQQRKPNNSLDYRQFIKDFSTYAKLLCKLTEKGAEFQRTADCQNAFLDLRRKLESAQSWLFPTFQNHSSLIRTRVTTELVLYSRRFRKTGKNA